MVLRHAFKLSLFFDWLYFDDHVLFMDFQRQKEFVYIKKIVFWRLLGNLRMEIHESLNIYTGIGLHTD